MEKTNLLTSSEITYVIVGSMLGVGILSLPSSLAQIAKNDGWIGAIVGSLYPFYMIFLAIYIFKKKNLKNMNIIALSEKYFGKIIGTILALIFSLQFLVYMIITTSNLGNMIRTYIILFLQQYKIVFPVLIISIYTASKGIKSLGRINEIIFYVSIPLIFVSFFALKQVDIQNIMPIFSNGFLNIMRASLESFFSFVGIEIIFLLPPLMKDKKDIKKSFVMAAVIVVCIYIWFSFLAVYHFGPDVTQALYWPVIALTETVNMPGISDFKYIFMVLWSSIVFKTIANQMYFFNYSLSNIFTNINSKLVYIGSFVISIYFIHRLDRIALSKQVTSVVSKFYVAFNLVYITTILLLVLIKKEDKNGKIKNL